MIVVVIVCIISIGIGEKALAANIKDLKASHSSYQTVSKYVDQGFVSLQNGYLYPNHSITRGEMAQMLFNALRLPNDAKVELVARDLVQSHPNYNALHKLIDLQIMNNSEYVRPNEMLTRAQTAKIISLAFNIEVDAKNDSKFNDYSRTYWAKDYIESLADVQIIKGKTAKTFAPEAAVTRIQFITLVSRGKSFSSKVNNLECVYDFLSKKYIDTKQVNSHFTKDVIAIVNNERALKGLSALKEDPKLNQLAVVKLNDMINRNYFEHKSPFYGLPWDMANYFDYSFKSLGENLALNLYTPKSVMQGWMASPTHKENILKRNYTHIGVAGKRDTTGNYYWVQLFSSR